MERLEDRVERSADGADRSRDNVECGAEDEPRYDLGAWPGGIGERWAARAGGQAGLEWRVRVSPVGGLLPDAPRETSRGHWTRFTANRRRLVYGFYLPAGMLEISGKSLWRYFMCLLLSEGRSLSEIII